MLFKIDYAEIDFEFMSRAFNSSLDLFGCGLINKLLGKLSTGTTQRRLFVIENIVFF